MHHLLEKIAKNIEQLEIESERTAEQLRLLKQEDFPEALERGLIHEVSAQELSGKIASVDGGLLAEELHGFDLVIARAVGVLFEYEGVGNSNKMKSCKYFPSSIPPLEMDAIAGLEQHEFSWHKSLFRIRKELTVAREMIDKFSPRAMLMDGSLVPQISDKPTESNSEVRMLYDYVVGDYKGLYSAAQEKNCMLVGVIKDSRGKRFIEILSKAGFPISRLNDTGFLNFLLQEGERTFSFSYSQEAEKNQILRDLGEWGKKMNVFYLKSVSEDRPMRIEFLNNAKTDDVASLIYSLSKINRRYGYPAILIEADMRAALDKIEFDRAYRDLFVRAGMRKLLARLRRNTRPFR